MKVQKLKVISAIGMFYDLEDPSEFIKHAADALDYDGTFVAQLMCSHSMYKSKLKNSSQLPIHFRVDHQQT